MHLPKPRSTTTGQKERDRGRYWVPWQEGEVGINPTGWNARRVAGDGDPARSSGAVLGQEREREAVRGRDEWVWGSWNSPCPVLTPRHLRHHGSTTVHRGSTARAEVPHTGR